MRVLSSEWLKTKRTPVRWITFFMPVIFSLCIISYLKIRSGISTEFIYEAFFTIWTGVIMPVGVGLLSGFLVHEEEMAGNFNRFLNVGVSKTRLYIGKFIFLALCLLICTLIATAILCVGMEVVLPNGGNLTLFFTASLLETIGLFPLLAIHLWISFLWGMGVSIGVGMCGILMATLIGATSLGEKIWMLCPWAWSVKMSMFPIIYSFSPSAIISQAFARFFIEIILSVITFALFLLLGITWFYRWEGRKVSE